MSIRPNARQRLSPRGAPSPACLHGSAALPPRGSASTALSPRLCGSASALLCLHGPVSTALRLCLHAALPPRPCPRGPTAPPPRDSASAALSPWPCGPAPTRLSYGSASTRLCLHGPASTALGALFETYKSPLAGHKPPRRLAAPLAGKTPPPRMAISIWQPPWRAKTPLGGHQPRALLGSSPDRPWSPLGAQRWQRGPWGFRADPMGPPGPRHAAMLDGRLSPDGLWAATHEALTGPTVFCALAGSAWNVPRGPLARRGSPRDRSAWRHHRG